MIFPKEHTIPKMIKDSVSAYGNLPAQQVRIKDGVFRQISYREMFQNSLDFGAALIKHGVGRNQPVGLIADNCEEWLNASVGIMSIGAFDVPRGCNSTADDLMKILSITECKIVVTQNAAQINKLVEIKKDLPHLEKIISIQDNAKPELLDSLKALNLKYISFKDIVIEGKQWRVENPGVVEKEVDKGSGDELATIIFTSGTTGNPKGVMLTHSNFLLQLDECEYRMYLNPGENCLSVLPVWHVFEREMEYIILAQGAAICYSKTIASIMLSDMKTLNPVMLPTVPRVFEALKESIIKNLKKSNPLMKIYLDFFVKLAIIHKRMERKMFAQNPCFTSYKKPLRWTLFLIPWTLMWPFYELGNLLVYRNIKAAFGNKFVSGVTGGGAFPQQLDEFFWATGVRVIEAYGLTETSPMVAMRPFACPVFRTIGSAIRHVQVRVVDPSDGHVLDRGQKGLLQVKGPTVMQGYYKRPDLTAKAINPEGWFDTGDLAIITIHDDIQIKGRIKDTIVLSNGENLEPVPIEAKLAESKLISRAVVVGQDQRYLGALILVDMDELNNFIEDNGIIYDSYEDLLESELIQSIYKTEIDKLINSKTGFKIYEQINKFCLLNKTFEVGVELSAKQEVMRFKVAELYKEQIENLFK